MRRHLVLACGLFAFSFGNHRTMVLFLRPSLSSSSRPVGAWCSIGRRSCWLGRSASCWGMPSTPTRYGGPSIPRHRTQPPGDKPLGTVVLRDRAHRSGERCRPLLPLRVRVRASPSVRRSPVAGGRPPRGPRCRRARGFQGPRHGGRSSASRSSGPLGLRLNYDIDDIDVLLHPQRPGDRGRGGIGSTGSCSGPPTPGGGLPGPPIAMCIAGHWSRVEEGKGAEKAVPGCGSSWRTPTRCALSSSPATTTTCTSSFALAEGRARSGVRGNEVSVGEIEAYLSRVDPSTCGRPARPVPPGLPVTATRLDMRPQLRAAGLRCRMLRPGRVSGGIADRNPEKRSRDQSRLSVPAPQPALAPGTEPPKPRYDHRVTLLAPAKPQKGAPAPPSSPSPPPSRLPVLAVAFWPRRPVVPPPAAAPLRRSRASDLPPPRPSPARPEPARTLPLRRPRRPR